MSEVIFENTHLILIIHSPIEVAHSERRRPMLPMSSGQLQADMMMMMRLTIFDNILVHRAV